MKLRTLLLCVFFAVCALGLAACDTGTTPSGTPTSIAAADTPTTSVAAVATVSPTAEASQALPTDTLPADTSTTAAGDTATPAAAVPAPSESPEDTAAVVAPPTQNSSAPSPTPVTATSTGADITALQALAVLKAKALAWQGDAKLGLLANTRPGQQKNLLGGALGSPDVNETTPGGKGRNWTLVAFSQSAHSAVAISMDGTQVDLVKEGDVTSDTVNSFTGSGTDVLALSALDTAHMVDSDKVAQAAAARGTAGDLGVALLAPNGLGLGPLPTPQTGGQSPQIAYEAYVQSTSQLSFVFFDATTGAVVLDSSAP